jgi:N-acyl-phosphatidylethanolamine-hydrolysing phospholipase D
MKIVKVREAKLKDPKVKPAHHKPDGSGFLNPWPSFQTSSLKDMLKLVRNFKPPKLLPGTPGVAVVPIDFNRIQTFNQGHTDSSFLLTWLGHAAFLLSSSGMNILLDPCFSDRCSPVSFLGPKRFTPIPFKFEELPAIDVIIISHNHYDHLDLPTLKKFLKSDTLIFVPLGNQVFLENEGFTHVVECDWWDEYELTTDKNDKQIQYRITCTPCQHFSGRSLNDRFKTLWSSWIVAKGDTRFFFAGDTGYRTVRENEDEHSAPICPVFKEIGQKYGPFQLAAIPIGAYSPRWFMSAVHCNPRDAVDLHLDVQSQKSIGMHWGTFALTDEPILEPPQKLLEELQQRGMDPSTFRVIQVGESVEI